MSITSDISILPVSKTTFDEVDAAVMQCAYAAQNHFGRLCEEQVYENDVKARLQVAGFEDVHTQVGLLVSHEGFRKKYILDLVVNQVLYELKATDALIPEHEAQALNYAALLGLNRVKLINFGGPKVEGKLRGTPFDGMDRRNIHVDKSEWQPLSDACGDLANWFERLIRNIGGHLNTRIYEEALVWFYGGENACVHRLPVRRDGREMGKHLCRFYCNDGAFVITGFKPGSGRESYRKQLQSLVGALPIHAFQWINVHHLDVSFVTIRN